MKTMTPLKVLRIALLAAASALAGASLAQGLPIVMGEPAMAEKALPEAKLRIAPAATGRQLSLAPVTDVEIERFRAENASLRTKGGARVNYKRVAIGVERELDTAAAPQAALYWVSVEGGRAARLSVTSPDASAMRVALNLLDVPTDMEMVFFEGMSSRIIQRKPLSLLTATED